VNYNGRRRKRAKESDAEGANVSVCE